uniref:Uncharacterized protein n=1 Tax=Cucumis melo TaxID=3656 RepID=A0A9I9DY34_CUCME
MGTTSRVVNLEVGDNSGEERWFALKGTTWTTLERLRLKCGECSSVLQLKLRVQWTGDFNGETTTAEHRQRATRCLAVCSPVETHD